MKTWHTIKGYVVGAVALIACPCHLPITLPLLIALTGSAWLAENKLLVGAISTVVFLGGLVLATQWIGQSKLPLPDIHAGLPRVTVITSSACSGSCRDAVRVWQAVREGYQFKFEEVDITSPRGRDLAATHNIFATPTTLVNGRVAFRGVPKLDHAAAAVKG